MKNLPSYIKASDVLLPLAENQYKAWKKMVEGEVVYSQQSLNQSESFPCMIFQEGTWAFEDACVAVANQVLAKLNYKQFDENTLLILSTTKGNIVAEKFEDKKLGNSAIKIAKRLGLKETPLVLSTACISGVSAVGIAAEMLQLGQARSILVIGGDQFSDFVFSGFQSFKALSQQLCMPYAAERDGLNLGEGYAAIYMDNEPQDALVQVLGYASSNDANHISGPSRDGEGLKISIEKALKNANLLASDIDFISSHGTATVYNDEMESLAYAHLNIKAPVLSFKSFIGHTLGGSGVIEIAMSIESMKQKCFPKHLNTNNIGVSGEIEVLTQNFEEEISYLLKTASGFGGCNASIVLKNIC